MLKHLLTLVIIFYGSQKIEKRATKSTQNGKIFIKKIFKKKEKTSEKTENY